uniref:Mitochondrial cytochrome c oxidase subunit VIc/VIIs domain-containing protein n=1 Tax=Cyprinus carpio carpio TaxID=630221 RepID=A0A8C1EEQ5_CYPCA
PDVRAEGRELNEVNNVPSKASNERPPRQAFEVSFAHRIRSLHHCSSRLQVCVFLQFTVTEPRKQAYADFYKHYDSMKEFSAMREAGVFESVRPTGK